jgi:hypothetical protein
MYSFFDESIGDICFMFMTLFVFTNASAVYGHGPQFCKCYDFHTLGTTKLVHKQATEICRSVATYIPKTRYPSCADCCTAHRHLGACTLLYPLH